MYIENNMIKACLKFKLSNLQKKENQKINYILFRKYLKNFRTSQIFLIFNRFDIIFQLKNIERIRVETSLNSGSQPF